MTDEQADALVSAAKNLLMNAIDQEVVLVDEDNDDDDYPVDEDGERWYHDWWELRLALEAL